MNKIKKHQLTGILLAGIMLLCAACGEEAVQPSSDSEKADQTTEATANDSSQALPETELESIQAASDDTDVNDSDIDESDTKPSGRICDQTLPLSKNIPESIWEDSHWIEFGKSEYGEIAWTLEGMDDYQAYYRSEDDKRMCLYYDSLYRAVSVDIDNGNAYQEKFVLAGRICDQTLALGVISESIWEDLNWIEFGESEYGEIPWRMTRSGLSGHYHESTYESEDGRTMYVSYGTDHSRMFITVWTDEGGTHKELYKKEFVSEE